MSSQNSYLWLTQKRNQETKTRGGGQMDLVLLFTLFHVSFLPTKKDISVLPITLKLMLSERISLGFFNQPGQREPKRENGVKNLLPEEAKMFQCFVLPKLILVLPYTAFECWGHKVGLVRRSSPVSKDFPGIIFI